MIAGALRAVFRAALRPRTAWISVVLLTVVGCSGTTERPLPDPLPFRVALLPARIIDDATGVGRTGFQVQFEPEWFNQRLARELSRRTFVDVMPIEVPDSIESDLERDRYAIESAAEADLLLEPIIRYDSRIEAGRNERYLDSLHLFFTGPFLSWAIEDWNYAFGQPVRLTARTYFTDTAEAPLRLSTRLDQKLLEDDPQVEAEDPRLSFLERTGDRWEQYALAVFVPSLLLGGDEKIAAEEIREDVVRDLAERLVIELGREPRLYANPYKANVRLLRREPAWKNVDAGGQPRQQITLDLGVCDPQRPGLHSVRFEGGERRLIEASELLTAKDWGLDPSAPPPQEGYGVRVQGLAPVGARTVRVEVWDAQDSLRSFTFVIPQ
ncbi:MAG: hypothetical protein AAF488_03310 [Planctomycetota bacterium]